MARRRKPPKCPSTDDPTNKMLYTCHGTSFSLNKEENPDPCCNTDEFYVILHIVCLAHWFVSPCRAEILLFTLSTQHLAPYLAQSSSSISTQKKKIQREMQRPEMGNHTAPGASVSACWVPALEKLSCPLSMEAQTCHLNSFT